MIGKQILLVSTLGRVRFCEHCYKLHSAHSFYLCLSIVSIWLRIHALRFILAFERNKICLTAKQEGRRLTKRTKKPVFWATRIDRTLNHYP